MARTAAKSKPRRQKCPRCGKKKPKNGWLYCRVCANRIRREMVDSGYLTPCGATSRGPLESEIETRKDGTVHVMGH